MVVNVNLRVSRMSDPDSRYYRLMQFVCDYQIQHNYPPTIREIGKATGITSTSVVDYHLEQLRLFGMVEKLTEASEYKSRNTHLTELGLDILGKSIINCQCCGQRVIVVKLPKIKPSPELSG